MLLKGSCVRSFGDRPNGTTHPQDDIVCNTATTPNPTPNLGRRGFLKASVGITSLGMAPGLLLAAPKLERQLTLYTPSTGEMIRLVYWTPTEGYIEESVSEISEVMRDRHSGAIKRIDPQLFDVIYALQELLETRRPVHILSGYRSPETNAALRRTNKGVARASLHMKGMAADIRMPDRDFNRLHRAALSLGAGGVGRYRRSRFIHVDTGPVRHWG